MTVGLLHAESCTVQDSGSIAGLSAECCHSQCFWSVKWALHMLLQRNLVIRDTRGQLPNIET